MRKIILFLLVCKALTRCTSSSDNPDGHPMVVKTDSSYFTFPAEFEEQEAVWIKWTAETYWRNSTDVTVKAIVKALNPYVKVKLVVTSEEEKNAVKMILEKERIPFDHVEFVINPISVSRWIRDSGPIFVKNNQGKLKIVDFGYTLYGVGRQDDPGNVTIDMEDRSIAHMNNLPLIRSSLVSEGGDRDFNGEGTLMVTESVEMQRNPDMTKEEIEKELMRVLGQKKVIWLKTGPVEGDQIKYQGALPGNLFTSTICGHIDEYARFAGPNTILLAKMSEGERRIDAISEATYSILEENYNILKKSTDQDGKPFKIIRVPVTDRYYATHVYEENTLWHPNLSIFPHLKYYDGTSVKNGDTTRHIIASSYLNFLVTNGSVLVAAYYKDGRPQSTILKDEQARKILQQVFPDRKIIPIYEAEYVNAGGGGIHCITQQEPSVKKRILTQIAIE